MRLEIAPMPTVTFSLKSSQWDALDAVSDPGESRNLAAKRIFLGALGDPESSAPDPGALEYLQHCVKRLEEVTGIRPNVSGPDRLDKIEERLDSLPDLSKIDYLQSVLEHLVKRCEEQLNSPPPIALWESRLGEIEQKFAHLSPGILESPPAPPSRLPKATRRQLANPTPTEDN